MAPAARVLLVVDSLECGGAERHVVDLALALQRRGTSVTVACSSSGPLAADLGAAGIPFDALMPRLVKRRFSVRFGLRLRRLVAERRVDLVHAHIHASATASAAAVAGRPVPLVVTDHTESPWRGPIDRAISRVACRRPEKGIDRFLRAAATVAARVPQARFLVVGEGPMEPQLRALARELGIDERVHFLGHRSDARAVIERLDVLVISSLTDGSPLVALEAMEVGTPVVGTATGGIPDQIEDGVNGLLVPPGDVAALADAMLRLAEDPARRRQLAQAASRRLQSEFSYEAMVERVLWTYRRAAERRGRRDPVARRRPLADRAPS